LFRPILYSVSSVKLSQNPFNGVHSRLRVCQNSFPRGHILIRNSASGNSQDILRIGGAKLIGCQKDFTVNAIFRWPGFKWISSNRGFLLGRQHPARNCLHSISGNLRVYVHFSRLLDTFQCLWPCWLPLPSAAADVLVQAFPLSIPNHRILPSCHPQ